MHHPAHMCAPGVRAARVVCHGLKISDDFTPRLTGHVDIHRSTSFNGIELTKDFFNPDGSPNFRNILYHDQLAQARFTQAGFGLDYQLNDRYALSFDWHRNFAVANTHIYDYDTTFSISRGF
ncbi:MAG: hypothetical protein JSR34_01480 [Proteobacteria bacterium]|nr:hypothetical protein [Pseudomonadota bacterium]